jgi:hypothetical protein
MEKKILMMLTVAALIALASISSTWAYVSFSIYGYTDKPQYRPGETGTLKIWVYNDGTEDLILKNMTLIYPWHHIMWGANETLVLSAAKVIPPKDNYNTTAQFTIPTDGRPTAGNVKIYVNERTDYRYLTLNVDNPPVYAFENMNNLITLFSALVIITLGGIVGIVFTIYLTARRPKMVWAEEPKQQ